MVIVEDESSGGKKSEWRKTAFRGKGGGRTGNRDLTSHPSCITGKAKG
jgi:hypothetical protein